MSTFAAFIFKGDVAARSYWRSASISINKSLRSKVILKTCRLKVKVHDGTVRKLNRLNTLQEKSSNKQHGSWIWMIFTTSGTMSFKRPEMFNYNAQRHDAENKTFQDKQLNSEAWWRRADDLCLSESIMNSFIKRLNKNHVKHSYSASMLIFTGECMRTKPEKTKNWF